MKPQDPPTLNRFAITVGNRQDGLYRRGKGAYNDRTRSQRSRASPGRAGHERIEPVHGALKAFSITAVGVAILVGLLVWDPQRSDGKAGSLLVYCAAGIQNPVAEVAREYEREFGVKVELQFGGSGTLLSNLRVAKKGDLYLAADTSYMDKAREWDLLAEAIPLAYQRPVIAVQKGNPGGIAGVSDLLRPGVKVALANPDAASVGKQTKILMERLGRWDVLGAATRQRGVFKPTVNEVANDVKIGTVQAGIIWDATVNQYPELEAVPIEGAESFVLNVTVGVLHSSRTPTAALRFARYLGARDKGLKTFERMGFPPVDGDEWALTPEITYYAGGVNRLGIQETLKEFERREGVRITTVYNGCGILMGSIQRGARPDGYHTCDASFMDGVKDLFTDAVDVSETDMVIVCATGRDDIKGLDDLGREGMKIGLANEQQSALGALTARLLKRVGLYEKVTPNVVSRTPTSDLLINQIRTGSLDAIIVYRANTAAVADKVQIVEMGLSDAKAVQTFAIGKESKYKHLMGRLFETIRTAESQRRFTEGGFRWIMEEGKTP